MTAKRIRPYNWGDLQRITALLGQESDLQGIRKIYSHFADNHPLCYALVDPYYVKVDYFPEPEDERWITCWTLWHNDEDLGRVFSISFGDTLILKLSHGITMNFGERP